MPPTLSDIADRIEYAAAHGLPAVSFRTAEALALVRQAQDRRPDTMPAALRVLENQLWHDGGARITVSRECLQQLVRYCRACVGVTDTGSQQ